MMQTEVRLPVDIAADQPPFETVPAEQIGPSRFRLLGSPGFASGVAMGDEIEMTPGVKPGYRVLGRSGVVCVQLFLRTCTLEDRRGITAIASSKNGRLGGGMDSKRGHLLIYDFHVAGGFDAIEAAMSQIAGRFDVDRWMYGNVYEADGVTPLNWWTCPSYLSKKPR